MRALTGSLSCAVALGLSLSVAPLAHSQATPAEEQESSPAGNPSETRNQAERPEAEENAQAPGTGKASAELKRDAVVVFGENVEVKAGETAEVVVVIGGSAKIHGKVRDSVVVVGGNVEVDGEVRSEVVAVMGGILVRPPGVIGGDVVSVGGKLDVQEGATVKGHAQEVAVPGMRLPHVDWIQQWLAHCVLMFRPLAPQVGWLWVVTLVFFAVYLFIAAVFRHPVQASVNELTERPATTFVMGLLVIMLLPVFIFLLAVLVIGIPLIPFLIAAVILLSLLGKVAVLEWIGMKIGSLARKEGLPQPVLALVIGFVVLTVLYMIPVFGLLTMLLLSVWSIGCAITSASRGFRRELPERSSSRTAAAAMPAVAAVAGNPPSSTGFAPFSSTGEAVPGQGIGTSTPPASLAPPVMPDVLVYPKATFWERIAAAFLDVVLVIILGRIVGDVTATLIIGLAYVTGMWTWRGTTVGGIVLGLKVVRMDGAPVSFAVALVRGLAAGFSALVLFLGFFWIAWDRDKQGWHDKIAGTVVLRLPRGTPLVCF
jgi:uncharacterized RDD family membrane protein YckC